MIECIFTLDYEIYGDGGGSLDELVFEPTETLSRIFADEGLRFVVFVEVSELEIIERYQADSAIWKVRDQIRRLHREHFEIGLHLHPQWYNATRANGHWILDDDEYNLCKLPRQRIIEIVDGSIEYLRGVLEAPQFTPLSFRAGNWLFQPSKLVAETIAAMGIKLDSSVFKGGVQRRYGLDYRKALRNGYYWPFSEHVDLPDPAGILLEIPTYTRMVPFWKMLTGKRIGMEKRKVSSHRPRVGRVDRFLDLIRPMYPLKLDFCRMTIDELTSMFATIIREEADDPATLRPIVAIGHTKELTDFATIRLFLSFLKSNDIQISTFNDVYHRCLR